MIIPADHPLSPLAQRAGMIGRDDSFLQKKQSGKHPYSILPLGRVFRTEDSSVRRSLPYGRVYRTEEFTVRKTLLYGRRFRTEEPSVRKILPYGRLFRMENSSARKSLLSGRLVRTKKSFVWRSRPWGLKVPCCFLNLSLIHI